MYKYLNKGISAPIAIGIVLILVVLVGGSIFLYIFLSGGTKPLIRCGSLGMDSEYINPSACNRICVADKDCKFTCGCEAINKNETCRDEGVTYNCVDREVRCENNVCVTGEEKVQNETADWKSCSIDDDCVCCDGSSIGDRICINKNYSSELDCKILFFPLEFCSLNECKCIDNICTAKLKDETADWKTYTDKEYGFKLRHPSNWKIKTITPSASEAAFIFYQEKSRGEIASMFFIKYDSFFPAQGVYDSLEDRFLDLEDRFLDIDIDDMDYMFGIDSGLCKDKKEKEIGGSKAIECGWVKDVVSTDKIKAVITEYVFEEDRGYKLEKIDYSYLVALPAWRDKMVECLFVSFVNSSLTEKEKDNLYSDFRKVHSSFKILD